jgi:hypothetical protein
MAEVEEPLDLIFYRPIAFGFVKLIYRLPITPNQVTLLSLASGLVAAYYFSSGAGAALALGALWYAVANILDCGDGMLARLQGSGSPLGRLMDGIIDWIIGVAVFVALGIGLEGVTGDSRIWFLVIAGGLSSALHALMFDFHQQEYLSHVRGTTSFHSRETDKARGELRRLEESGGPWWRRMVMVLYLQYMKIQDRVQTKTAEQRHISPEIFREHNRRIMRWWTLLGSTTNRSLLMIAALLDVPALFLWIVVVPGNLFLLFMLLQQRNVRRRMEALAG